MNNQLRHRMEEVQNKRRIPVYMLILIGLFFLGFIIYMLLNWRS